MESQTPCTVLCSMPFNYWIEREARIAFQVIVFFVQLNSGKQGTILRHTWLTEMKTIIPIQILSTKQANSVWCRSSINELLVGAHMGMPWMFSYENAVDS